LFHTPCRPFKVSVGADITSELFMIERSGPEVARRTEVVNSSSILRHCGTSPLPFSLQSLTGRVSPKVPELAESACPPFYFARRYGSTHRCRYVAYYKDSHCHAPVIKDGQVLWCGALLYQGNRFAYVRQEHPITGLLRTACWLCFFMSSSKKTHDPGHGYPHFGSTPWRNTRIAINKFDTTVKI
jgi:hypothetical protein